MSRLSVAMGLLLLLGCAQPPGSYEAAPSAPPSTTQGGPPPAPHPAPTPSAAAPLTSAALRQRLGVASIRPHLEELQRIADAHGGNRAAGSPGFDASAEYVATRLAAAGYGVERQAFTLATAAGDRSTVNLIVELPGTVGADVVMFGAHLDSLPVGPGINDNGSGSMTLLAMAEALATFDRPAATVRFAFWSAEEVSHEGSEAYVASLSPAERDRIVAYLNLDILASPNHVRFVYAEPAAAAGSELLTELFARHFEGAGLAWQPVDLTGKSDHEAFMTAGIPTGGLFSGGTERKTGVQAAAFGGTAGAPADPCIHRACDTIANLSDVALEEMGDAAAHALATLATG